MNVFRFNAISILRGYCAQVALISSLSLLLAFMPLLAAEGRDAFQIKGANFSLHNSLLELNAEFEIELPAYIKTAVEQGFAVPLMFQVEILTPKKYWLDEKIITLKQRYQLHFLPMLSSYAVFDLNAGQRYYFDSLSEAVHYLQVVYNYPMLDINNISADRSFYARIRVGIDSDELPVPLKSSSLWENDWGLTSDWYAWDIEKTSYE
jgi:hypothetical protein